ncbi:hypothetical protein BH10CHL1_BH10CHL1_06600 [soil metagenome]
MAIKLEITQLARLENLSLFRSFIEQACQQNAIDQALCYQLKLVVDEGCTNIISYGYTKGAPGSITLTFQREAQQVEITLSDQGRPFDPNQAPTPALDDDWEARPIGGLGVYLMQTIMDKLHYQADPHHGNCLTLIKELRS